MKRLEVMLASFVTFTTLYGREHLTAKVDRRGPRRCRVSMFEAGVFFVQDTPRDPLCFLPLPLLLLLRSPFSTFSPSLVLAYNDTGSQDSRGDL